jgi:adenylylsulfate reductase subunit B
MRAFNQEPEQCWECYSCVKICPQGTVQPMRSADSIMWMIKFRNGVVKRFKFPIRTTAEGSIEPFTGKPMPKLADIGTSGTFTLDTMGGYRKGKPEELIRK